MALDQNAQLGMSMRFKVVVDDIDLGGWATCAGLQVDFTTGCSTRAPTTSTSTMLPERVTYKTIVLSRAMTQQDSAQVQGWLATWSRSGTTPPRRATTRPVPPGSPARRECPEVVSWSLRNVYPVRWSGPDLNARGTEVAFEALELVHEGFL